MDSDRGKLRPYADERKQYATEMQSRSLQLFVTLASIGDAVITTDSTGMITFLNPVAEELTGWSLEDAVGLDSEDVFRVLDESTGAVIPDPVQRAINTVSTVGLPSDSILIRRDGTQLPVDDSAAPIVDAVGNVLGAVLVFRDVAERKKTEKMLKYRSELDRMAARISTAFITSPVTEVDAQIVAALREIGEFLQADRSYVFLFSSDDSTLSCTHSWSGAGIEPMSDRFLELPVSLVPLWFERILAREYVYVTGTEDIPDHAVAEKSVWEQWAVQTFAAVPMSQEDKVLGFIGVDAVREPRPWPEETIDLLYLIGNVFASAMARRDALERLEKAREQEVQIGSRIQQSLLLSDPPSVFADFRVAALSIPSRRIDGDFYDFLLHPNRCLDVIFGDVMGKGVPAALLAAGSKTEFLRSLTHLLAVSPRGSVPQPQDIVNAVHEVLTQQLLNLDSFVTLSYIRFDPGTRTAILVDCGNTRLIRCTPEGVIEHLPGYNLPLGFSQSEDYTQAEYPYSDGDLFVLYSDGATEARSPTGEMFGIERISETVAERRFLTPSRVIEAIKQRLADHVGNGTLSDDFTCVVIKVVPESGALGLPSAEEIRISSSLSELSLMRDFLRGFCALRNECCLDEQETHLLELAITEVASNITKHAYEGAEDRDVWVSLELSETAVTARLSHAGRPFVDPGQVPAPAFDGSRESGFGLFIINHSVDEINYGTDARGRHYIELVKHLSRREE